MWPPLLPAVPTCHIATAGEASVARARTRRPFSTRHVTHLAWHGSRTTGEGTALPQRELPARQDEPGWRGEGPARRGRRCPAAAFSTDLSSASSRFLLSRVPCVDPCHPCPRNASRLHARLQPARRPQLWPTFSLPTPASPRFLFRSALRSPRLVVLRSAPTTPLSSWRSPLATQFPEDPRSQPPSSYSPLFSLSLSLYI